MLDFYRKDSDYAATYNLFFSIIEELEKKNKVLEINKLSQFETPSCRSNIIPLLYELYSDSYAVSEAISNTLKIKNFSNSNINDFDSVILDTKYLIFNKVIYFTNPLSEESQQVINSIKDYDESEILFTSYGIIQSEQIKEIRNKIDNDFKNKKIDLDNLSVSKIFQDLLKYGIELKSNKIKIFTDNNIIKATFMLNDDFINKNEFIISNINNFNTIKEHIESKFENNTLRWKYFNEFYKVILNVDKTNNIYIDLYNLSKEVEEIDNLNLNNKDLTLLYNSLKTPSGVIVISGFNNSGKRSIFYSCLKYINTNRKGINIATIEDYVKNNLNYVTQIENKSSIDIIEGVENNSVLGIIAVNDLDIENAFKIAATGKLVVLSVNSSTVFNTINRVYNAINDKNLISENLLCFLHTALIKTVCPSCSTEQQFNKNPEAHLFMKIDNAPMNEYVRLENTEGCQDCFNGFDGRVQVLEILDNDEIMKELILETYNLKNFRIEKRSKSWRSVFESSMELLIDNKVSLNSIIQSIGYYKK